MNKLIKAVPKKMELHKNEPIERQRKPLLVVSLHKSGTHLICRILEKMGFVKINIPEEGITPQSLLSMPEYGFFQTHYTPRLQVCSLIEQKKIYAIFHYRDPRDVVVFPFNWHHPNNTKVTNIPREFIKKIHKRFEDDQEFLQFIIRDERHHPEEISFAEQFRWSRCLLYHPNIFKTSFETLVGSGGGGDDIIQLEMLRNLQSYLEIEVDTERIAQEAFSSEAKTFNEGQIGGFKKVFSPETNRLFNELYSDILRQYGYTIY